MLKTTICLNQCFRGVEIAESERFSWSKSPSLTGNLDSNVTSTFNNRFRIVWRRICELEWYVLE